MSAELKQEQVETKEKLHPNNVLNRAMDYYLLNAIEKGMLREKGDPKIVMGVIEHFARTSDFNSRDGGLPPKEDFEEDKNTILELGKAAFTAYSTGKSVREVARGKFDPRLLAYAPQALLFYSYLPLLSNLKEVALGEMEYGFGKKLNRLQPHNALAAGEMMKAASIRVAGALVEKYKGKDTSNLSIFELGCGNASFSAEVIEAFSNAGLIPPVILATDLDPATQVAAQKLFREKGISEKLNVMKVDMGNLVEVAKAANKLGDREALVHIGFILHESRELAERTLSALTQVFKNKKVTFAFSEYFLQDDPSNEVPAWFQTLHHMTQELFDRDGFFEFNKSFGLKLVQEIPHNLRKDTGEVINSTTLWTVAS